MLDPLLLGDRLELCQQAGVTDHRRVHDEQARALALLGDTLVFGDAGGIDTQCGVEADDHVRIDAETCGPSAAAADLFLDSKDAVDLAVVADGGR